MKVDSFKKLLNDTYEQSLYLKETAVAYQDTESYWLFRQIADKIKACKELLDKHEWKVKV